MDRSSDRAGTELAIEVDGLVKSFGETKVLEGISFSVRPGEIFGYVGPNGAGKSTTVKILVGLLGRFAGDVRVCGFDVRQDPLEVKRRIGFLPENAQLFDALTVQEHILLAGRLHGLADDVIMSRGRQILTGFELAGRLASRVGSLSKGMRQKLMITSALLHDPAVLFFDEPLSGLDVHSAVLIKELLQALAQRGKTVFYCSHIMDVVERVCDRIAILTNGQIVANGTFEQLASQQGPGSTLEKIFLQLTSASTDHKHVESILAALDGKTV